MSNKNKNTKPLLFGWRAKFHNTQFMLVLVFMLAFGGVGSYFLLRSQAAGFEVGEFNRQDQLRHTPPHTVSSPRQDNVFLQVVDNLGCTQTFYTRYDQPYLWLDGSTCTTGSNLGKRVSYQPGIFSRFSPEFAGTQSDGSINGLAKSDIKFYGKPVIARSPWGILQLFAVSSNGKVYVANSNTDGSIGFSTPQALPDPPVGVTFGGSPAVVESAPFSNSGDTNGGGGDTIFVRGTGGVLYSSTRVGTTNTFSNWTNLGGVLTSDPVAVTAQGGTYIFGTGSDKAIYSKQLPSGEWRSLGGVAEGGPAVGLSKDGNLQVFVRGYHDKIYDNIVSTQSCCNKPLTFGGWAEVPGNGFTISDPMVTYSRYGYLQLFVIGTDKQLYSNMQQGYATNLFEGWRPLPKLVPAGRTIRD